MGGLGDVVVKELPAHGEVKRGSDNHVDLVHGLGCQAGAIVPAGGGEPVIERVEVIGPQSTHRDRADRWIDVAIDEPCVSVGGRGSDLASLERHPRLGEEPPELHRSSPCRRRAGVVTIETSGGELGVVSVVADGMPAASFSAGERVEAVVGDDVEAVLALHDVGHAFGHRRLRSQPEELVAQNGSFGSLGRGAKGSRASAGLGDVEAEACVRGEALGVHAVEDGDASVDVVVELDVMLSLMGAQESSDVLDDSALERQREGEEQRVELGPVEALLEVGGSSPS